MSFRLEDHFFTKERLDQKVNYLGAEDPRPGFRVCPGNISITVWIFRDRINREKNLHLRVGCDEKLFQEKVMVSDF